MYKIKKCEEKDICLLRDFLQKTYKNFDELVNWNIDRLNFTYSMSRIMNGVTEEEYRNSIRLYTKNDEIIAAVNTEGENRGEAFFQITSFDLDEDMLDDMFSFAKQLTIKTDEKEYVMLRINRNAEKIINKALEHNFERYEDKCEVTSKMLLDSLKDDSLSKGYKYISSDKLSYSKKALGHGKAFGYSDREEYLLRSAKGLEETTKMSDYKKEDDIHIVDEEGEVVAFATMWYDSKNQIGILEPVGTHPDHRRKGLAKSAIFRGCNNIFKRGAKAVYVGSDQEFYKSIGFYEASYGDLYIYTKK